VTTTTTSTRADEEEDKDDRKRRTEPAPRAEVSGTYRLLLVRAARGGGGRSGDARVWSGGAVGGKEENEGRVSHELIGEAFFVSLQGCGGIFLTNKIGCTM
jgi:hypothetical protein